jgi:hypothetical protein
MAAGVLPRWGRNSDWAGSAVRAGPPADRPVWIAAKWYPAGMAGYGTTWDRSPGGPTMPELLLIDVGLCAALIMVAALLVIRRWRRSNGQPPAPASARGAAAEPTGKAMAPREIAIVPGFSDTVPPGPAAQVPAQREQAAHPQARPAASPQPGPHGPGPPPNGQRATAGAVTTSEQIASYYDQADKPMADYLTTLGWTHQSPRSPESPGSAERARRHPPQSGGHRQ